MIVFYLSIKVIGGVTQGRRIHNRRTPPFLHLIFVAFVFCKFLLQNYESYFDCCQHALCILLYTLLQIYSVYVKGPQEFYCVVTAPVVLKSVDSHSVPVVLKSVDPPSVRGFCLYRYYHKINIAANSASQ